MPETISQRQETLANCQRTLRLISILLSYPTADWWTALPDCRTAAEALAVPQARQVLTEYIDNAEEAGVEEYERRYVTHFDFSQNTNLYLTTQDRTDFGKQAQVMHRYKELFLENGYDTDKELPDYLPALLELAAVSDAAGACRILTLAEPQLKLLRERLIEAKLPQAFLLDIVALEQSLLSELSAAEKGDDNRA